MELKQLTYFLAVAENLSFSRAAEKLYISQPTLSYQIAELERELGAELFVRNRRSVALTLTGQRLVKPAREMMRSSTEIRMIARRHLDETGFHQRLCLYFQEGTLHQECTGVARTLGRFIQSHPKVDFSLHQANLDECLEQLVQGEMDVSIVSLYHNETLPAGLSEQTLYTDRLVAVLPKSSEQLGIRTVMEAFLTYELAEIMGSSRLHSRVLKYLRDMGLEPAVHPVYDLNSAFAYLFAERTAVVLPETHVRLHDYSQFRIIEMPGEAMELRCVAAWNAGNDLPALRELLADWRTELAAESQRPQGLQL